MARFDSRKRQPNAVGGRSVRREVKLTVEQNLELQVMAEELSLIHISEPTRRLRGSRMPSSA